MRVHVSTGCAAGPLAVEQLAVVNVSSTAVWLSWLVQAARHAAATQLRLSLVPADGGGARTALLNGSATQFSFRSAAAGAVLGTLAYGRNHSRDYFGQY